MYPSSRAARLPASPLQADRTLAAPLAVALADCQLSVPCHEASSSPPCCSPPPRPLSPSIRRAQVLQGTVAQDGLLPVHVDARGGPHPAVAAGARRARGFRAASSMSPRSRPGSARRRSGSTARLTSGSRLLVFRRVGRKIARRDRKSALPRHRRARPTSRQGCATASLIRRSGWATSPPRPPTAACSSTSPPSSPATTSTSPGRCASRRMAITGSCPSCSVADANFVRVFPRNIELRGPAHLRLRPAAAGGRTTSRRSTGNVSFIVRHSLIALPEPGYVPRRFDPRAGSFGMQVVDFDAPLGRPVVYELANRFRLEQHRSRRPPRSPVRNPIVFYIDRAAPEPIRTALREGVALVGRGVRGGGLAGRLPRRDPARGRRPARHPLQRRQLGQPRHPRLVLRPADRRSAHRRDHQGPGAARLAARPPGPDHLRRPWSAPA